MNTATNNRKPTTKAIPRTVSKSGRLTNPMKETQQNRVNPIQTSQNAVSDQDLKRLHINYNNFWKDIRIKKDTRLP